MKKIYHVLFCLVLLAVGHISYAQVSTCNWKSRNPASYFGDSCASGATKAKLISYITFNNSSVPSQCLKYVWKVNGTPVGITSNIFQYYVTQNGTYNVCVTVTDSCNNCDTTICGTRTISCITANTCNWKSRNPNTFFKDSCNTATHTYFIQGYLSFNTSIYQCFKYQWKVNGVNAGTGNVINHPITQNGTYNMCVTVTDTCNHCDTTFCSSRTITCVTNTPPPCNWQSRSPNSFFKDSCNTAANKYFILGYVSFNTPIYKCFKYQWKVNGVNAGNGISVNYPITQNGTYVVCATISDTCNNCDTTICSTRTITCIPNTPPPCNWKSRNPNTYFGDSCTQGATAARLTSYVALNSTGIPASCYKYQWKVNGSVVGGNNNVLQYYVYQNGTYNICVTVTDTCNHCDTTFCGSRTISCITGPTCTWKNRGTQVGYGDSCIGNTSCNIYGSVYFTAVTPPYPACYKYKWKVNGAVVANTHSMIYNATQNGTYTLCVTVSDTCDNCDTTICTTRTVNCIATGMQKTNIANNVNLYPNPTTGVLNLVWTAETCPYTVVTVTGQVLESGTISKGNSQLDFGKYQNGIYYLQFRTANGILSKIVAVQK